ncbi:uncharacterized protein (DUF697 family) [Variovorax boronicumulans]|uniref:Uncharacterized protein (DUF697 family) n=1 Tax=Variovorax boronicumulans TaxID=436515 RepID=A0AAW8DQG6_9BURK|nr:hypothetical protein [Variovorax boronicumulans]MDP9876427.1 uncharacterized protein (DUF697 family) [Variovorax boronicumulans]MDP9921711.1 uncharacterized protein (DUF697 family) [Variovorax boronicumulans]PBI89881.1 hypothetical protein BKP43_30130 [Variovorax boronicumulans]
MPSSIELARGDEKLIAAIHRSRRLIGRKALMAAAASAIPLPGVDWMADAALLSRLVPQISSEFGLSVTQVEKLAPHQRERIQKAATTLGALLVGRLVTRELLMKLARHAGIRLTAKQATKYVPIAGQVVSAALGYAALRALGEQHIKDCVRVSTTLALTPPEPAERLKPA